MKLKALALVSMLALSGNVMADTASASVVWTGLVPGSEDGETIKITGLGGGSIATGTLFVANNGTFTSNSVVLESRRANSQAAGEGSPGWQTGDLVNANWTLQSVVLNYGSTPATGAAAVVKNNGTAWEVGSQQTATNNITLSIDQTAEVETQVGEAVQAQVTVVASIAA